MTTTKISQHSKSESCNAHKDTKKNSTSAYKQAGVDIDAADELIDHIKPLAKSTVRLGTNASLGGFGGSFDLKAIGYNDPILIAGTDGVGTKLKIALAANHHTTIGIDLVAMCVNDVLAQGAEPLFFLDYYATGELDIAVAKYVISGIADGCKLAGCGLIGGETAEMPGMYTKGDYDLAGFCVGAVERTQMLPREVQAGDIMIGIGSSGPHANGYSLIRHIVAQNNLNWSDPAPFAENQSLSEALLEPTRIYVKSVLPLLKSSKVRAFAHITGGGLTDNVPRVLPGDLSPIYDETSLPLTPLFEWLQSTGKVSDQDMRRTFNCGIGGVLICDRDYGDEALSALKNAGEHAKFIGHIETA